MRGEGIFLNMLHNQAAKVTKVSQVSVYQATRAKATEQVLCRGRFSMLWIPLREIFQPGAFLQDVEIRQRQLLNPMQAAGPAAATNKISVKEL